MNSNQILNQLKQSFSGLAFVDPTFAGNIDTFFDNLTVGDVRSLIEQSRSQLESFDFSALSAVLDDPQLSGSLDNATRSLIEDLIDGNLSFLTSAFDLALSSLAGIAASTPFLQALDQIGNGGGGTVDEEVVESFINEVLEFFEGSTFADRIVVNGAVGRLKAGAGDDTVLGGGSEDNINGGGGDDNIRGRGGDDTLKGGGGGDDIKGNGGSDDIRGGGGNDTAKGGGGGDEVSGNGGRDRLIGGGGNDTMDGGAGNDTIKGGGGNDTFVYKTGAGRDVILDWKNGETIMITRGADEFADLSISQRGRDVLIEFANVDIIIKTDDVDNFNANDFMFM